MLALSKILRSQLWLLPRSSFTLLFFVIFFAASSLFSILPSYEWHDQQRILQLLLLVVALLFVVIDPIVLERRASLIILSIFIFGVCSSALAVLPLWAFKELFRFFGLFCLAILVAKHSAHPGFREFLIYLLALVGFLLAFQFSVSYLAVYLSGLRKLDVDLVVSGFSNPRAFGQFQVILMPILASLVATPPLRKSSWLRGLIFITLVIHWCICISLGGRGLWVALLMSSVGLAFIHRVFFYILWVQLAGGVLGGALFAVLFKLVPSFLSIEAVVRDGLRSGLSARDEIWGLAYAMVYQNPWFGVGPMHFAVQQNAVAAHPHQMFLQWAAEWGLPAALMLVVLCLIGVFGIWGFFRRNSVKFSDAGLAAAIIGALILAQVDGVFVMPYTETWCALALGLLINRFNGVEVLSGVVHRASFRIFAIVAVVALLTVLIRDAPHVPESRVIYAETKNDYFKPRFWSQGWVLGEVTWGKVEP